VKALLLAAGFGTRLRPLTLTTPKCLVEIKGKPLLSYWFENLSRAGVIEFLINTHYLSEHVEKFIKHSKNKDNIKIAFENNLLGTAGTIIKNANFFEEDDALIIHADNFCKQELRDLIETHQKRPKFCVMTMLVFRTNDPESCGIVEIDNDSVVKGFHEKIKNPPGNLANAAVYIISKEMISQLKEEYKNCSDFSIEILPNFINRIFAFETNKTFIDIGTPENYAKANGI
jgi:mannose-1-phosphate guanylyltransferase